MDTAMEQLRALVDASAAVSHAATPPTPIFAVAVALGLAPERHQYWNELCAESASPETRALALDLGLLLASTNVQPERIVALLRVLLVHPSFHGAGVLRLAQLTFRGLKLAKRWDVLTLASTELLDAVFDCVLRPDTRKPALDFYIDILVGFQHSAELYERSVPKLVTLAELVAAEGNDSALGRQFMVACAALAHCHRGYESEAATLQRAVQSAFGAQVERPTAAEAERLLRATAWVLPAEQLDQFLPSIEGKWVTDEFSNEQHASGAQAPQNAGSVLLKKTTNCFAHEVSAILEDPKRKAKLELSAYLFQQIPEMQVLMSRPDAMSTVQWELEGHWRQLHDENTPSGAPVAPAASLSPSWDCRACTMNNEASAMKCTTCGTDRPGDIPVPIVESSSKGSTPAPFSAVFDADMSFMRIKWSRGEQQGVWLARKEAVDTRFDLQTPLAVANDVMMDSVELPAYAFSTEGNPDSMLVLERSLLSTTSHTEFTAQAWIRPERSPSGDEVQIVLANGHDFELALTNEGNLVWQVAGGRYTVTSQHPLQFGGFSHVTLSFGQEKLVMMVDECVVGETARSPALDEAGPVTPGAALFTIGGSFECADPEEKAKKPSCFYGAILDLRIWSVVLANMEEKWSVMDALTGREAHLAGYYPLVGDSQRLLMDLSKQENHACVFEAYEDPDAHNDVPMKAVSTFAPATSLECVPVQHSFAVSLGNEFFGSGKFSFAATTAGTNGLRAHCGEAGAALWRQNAVSIAKGFQTALSLEASLPMENSASPPRTTAVFALCEASYWDLVPLLTEAAEIANPEEAASSRPDDTTRSFDGSALLVKISSHADASGTQVYSLGVHVWSKRRGYALSRAFRVAGGPSNVPSDVQITYELPGRVIAVAIGGIGKVFEVAVDLELALRMEPGSPVRTGVIFPPGQQNSTCLTAWTFEAFSGEAPQGQEPLESSVLGCVYAPLQSESSGDANSENDGSGSTTVCTRVSTDGSAVEQEAYGCQTCGLVHGNSICRICAVICHEGHELVAMGDISAACACRVRGNGLCRCSSAVPIGEFPQLSQPVKASLWCCSKCTVVNNVDLRECSVCGNSAPESSTGVSASGPAPSTSRALALFEPPTPTAPPATDWACAACTMLNNPTATKCSICDTEKPGSEPEVVTPSQEDAKDSGMATLFHAAKDAAKQPQPVATQATGPWYCSACTMENVASDSECHMCATVRDIPVADAVAAPEVIMAPPSSITETPGTVSAAASPMSTDMDATDGAAGATPITVTPASGPASKLENVKFLHGYKHTAAQAFGHLLNVGEMKDSAWETTAGKMRFTINNSFVGEYIRGTYLEKDGKLSGLARLTEEGAWKLDGRFKKTTQSQPNACTLLWDKEASRFGGKWYRGDGSGDWKCIASPYASDFCGLAPTNPAKKPGELQPFYSGMINMKENLTNVCYQNSFLQTLYMTQDFRRLILACDTEHYFVPFADNGTSSDGSIVFCIQGLFAQMTASQRPYLSTHALQRCLPIEFKNGRQQDTSDFAHFLIDSVSQQLSQHEDTTEDIENVFGGHLATILACKSCGKKSVNREYFWELLLNMIDLRYTPITSITAVSGSSMDIHTPAGYERLNTDLNKDRTGAPYVYLCVKRCPERAVSDMSMDDDSERVMPITELVVKVAPSAEPRPSMPGFERVDLDLNIGGGSTAGGKKQVYLFYRREPNGSPITDLQVIYGSEVIPDGFKQIQVDLNQSDGSKVFLCYRCDMPITDLQIVNSGIPGYRMVEHLLNVSHDDAVKQYLALKVSGNDPCLTDLKLIEGSEVAQYQEQGWQSIGNPVSTGVLPEASAGEETSVPAQLMVRRGHGNPIFAVDVFRAPRQVPKYNDYEVIDLFRSSEGPSDIVSQLQGNWVATEDTDRVRKAVRLRSVSDPIQDALLVKGALDDKGELSAVATRVSTWSGSIGAAAVAPLVDSVVPDNNPSSSSTSAANSTHMYHVTGYWKNAKVSSAQLLDVELRPAPAGISGTPSSTAMTAAPDEAAPRMHALSGTIGDGKGKPIAIQGVQTSRHVKIKWPISAITVLRGDERVPEGVQVVRETCSGRTANLLAQTTSPHTLYLAVKREENPTEGYISDVSVIYGEIDAVPENYTCVQTTPAGHSANLNDGTTGVPVFVCYRRCPPVVEEVAGGSAASTKNLMDLALMWTSGAQPDTLPSGFTKIQHTPLGMEANLNQGTTGVAIHLCYSKCDVKDVVKPLASALNGEYEITSTPLPAFGRFLSLSVVDELQEARRVEGNFGTVLHGNLPGAMKAVVYSSTHGQEVGQKTRTMLGVWRVATPVGTLGSTDRTNFLPSSFPFELTLSDTGTELDGWWSGADGVTTGVSKPTVPASSSATSGAAPSTAAAATGVVAGGKWKLVKDSYVQVAFKKDYGTEWQDGKLVFSERVWQHDIASMLSRFVATRTLGGDNALSCSECQRKTESRTHTVIFEPPAHLIITLKRMYYDWAQQKARKCLHDVRFPALLTLPSLSPDEEVAVYDASEGETQAKQRHRSRCYGLYGVLVHAGLTANSGHYYSFCRESDESSRQLHQEDSALAPWIKFNDQRVERSSWAEINRLVASTVSDTVYLLLYKKLSYDPSVEADVNAAAADRESAGGSDDEQEAMLLAKAMALSMSAAKHKQQEHEHEHEQEDTEETTVDPVDATANPLECEDKSRLGITNKVILKKVEAENAKFLRESLAATSSALHADDLHTLLALRHSLPLQLRAALDDLN